MSHWEFEAVPPLPGYRLYFSGPAGDVILNSLFLYLLRTTENDKIADTLIKLIDLLLSDEPLSPENVDNTEKLKREHRVKESLSEVGAKNVANMAINDSTLNMFKDKDQIKIWKYEHAPSALQGLSIYERSTDWIALVPPMFSSAFLSPLGAYTNTHVITLPNAWLVVAGARP